ncbi:MAG: TonB-dependent receptor [Chitinophagaceae bacterium]
MDRPNVNEVKGIACEGTHPFLHSILLLIVFFCLGSLENAHGQTLKITGHVSDKDGKPLAGVSVINLKTGAGTATNETGNFNIAASVGDSIQMNNIGYASKSILVSNQSPLTVILEPISKQLEEVIVVGYGTQRKEAVTGSVASISGASLNEMPSANVSQALQGRVAGVQILQTDSKPGATAQIRVRGSRSLNASNDPLIVLDGIPFPGTFADIDPNQIKSLDILKDASATAIYGSRGANGVILVTTNKGNQGSDPKVTYNGYYGLKTALKIPMMNWREYTTLKEIANIYPNLGTDEDSSGAVNTDWQKLLYTTGNVTSQDINMTSGTKRGSYSLGASYYRDEAVMPLQNYTRYAFHISLDQWLGKNIRIGFNSNSNFSITNGSSLSSYSALSASPLINPYDTDGSLKRAVSTSIDQIWVYTKQSLEALNNDYVDKTRPFNSYNSLFAEVKIPGIEGLKYRANVGLNYRQSNYGYYQGYGVFSYSESSISTATISNSHTNDWIIENLLIYDRTFAAKHKINFTGLYSNQQTTYWYSTVSATGIENTAFQFYNIGAVTDENGAITVDPNSQSYWQRGLQSYMGRLIYSFDDKYMATATLRSDGSSVLAAGHKWHTYPAISVGWNITREAFMQNVHFLDNLKLRVGYGQTSNQAVDPYTTQGQLTSVGYNYGTSTNATGYYTSLLANSDLGWEYTKTWNFAVDFSLLNNRISGTIEYYSQKTSDLLQYVSLPASSGVSQVLENVGSSQNKGLEISLNGTIIDNPGGFSWDAGINVYANRNKLTALNSGATEDQTNWWFVGHPIDVVYDYKKIGLWQTTDNDYQYLQTYEPGGNAGMIKVQYTGTYNSDGSPTRAIGTADRQIINLQPTFQGGFNSHFTYKDWELNIVGGFQSGGVLISTLYGSASYLNTLSGRQNNVKVDYWTPEHTNAKYPYPGGIVSSNNPKYGSTLGYFSGSYLKIRTMTLGYNFRRDWMKKVGITRLRVYATAQGPFVFFSPYHKESGLDPEPNSTGTSNQAVSGYPSRLLVVGYNTPTTYNYILGVNLSF